MCTGRHFPQILVKECVIHDTYEIKVRVLINTVLQLITLDDVSFEEEIAACEMCTGPCVSRWFIKDIPLLGCTILAQLPL